uniref:Putative ovule protein n=1 Tax=Solanum chacoense TaxID=4108 RepID=A0A0V0IPH1_SOLCH
MQGHRIKLLLPTFQPQFQLLVFDSVFQFNYISLQLRLPTYQLVSVFRLYMISMPAFETYFLVYYMFIPRSLAPPYGR